MPLSGNTRPLSGMHGTAAANMQGTGDAMSISSVVPEPPSPPQSKHKKKGRSKKDTKRIAPTSTKATDPSETNEEREKREKLERLQAARATRLRKQYPTMQNIPNSINLSQKKKLIALHMQNATDTSTLQPTHSAANKNPKDAGQAPTRKSLVEKQQKQRAASLKQQYPRMQGIPSKIGKGTKKKLIAQYKADSKAPAPSATMPAPLGTAAKPSLRSDGLPTQAVPPNLASGTQATRQTAHETPAVSSANSDLRFQRPTSYKMAPLSEERRAEVARNLAAGSNDDPVMID